MNDRFLESKGAEVRVGHGRERFPIVTQFHREEEQGRQG